MRQTVLFIAMSLDGFIADREGQVDWLEGQGDGENLDTYSDFIQHVDTVLMGWNTYHQVVTELSPEQWPYEGLTTYVFTHRQEPPREGIHFIDRDPVEFLEELKTRPGKDIWICGGAALARQLADSIDRWHLSVIPVLLGGGVRLFGDTRQKLKLIKTQSYNGITDLIYERR